MSYPSAAGLLGQTHYAGIGLEGAQAYFHKYKNPNLDIKLERPGFKDGSPRRHDATVRAAGAAGAG